MNDLKNMKAVNEQIKNDRIFSFVVSTLGAIIGIGAFIFSIHVLLG